ncbi:MAG: alpha/beta hydrolase [Spirochaetes bacterium]|nr:alpha/beta hydrolase [Spirochaetota bacterium]
MEFRKNIKIINFLTILILYLIFNGKIIMGNELNNNVDNIINFFYSNQNKENKTPFNNSFYTNIEFFTLKGIRTELKIHYRIWTNYELFYKYPQNIKNFDKKCIEKLFLIHGFAGSTYSYQNFSENFLEIINNNENLKNNNLKSKIFFIFAIDLPNFGYSERKKIKLSSVDFSLIILKLLKEFDKNYYLENIEWTLFGHSMGGRICLYTIYLYENFIENFEILFESKIKQSKNLFKIFNFFNINEVTNNEEYKKILLKNRFILISPAINNSKRSDIFLKISFIKKFLVEFIKTQLNYDSIKKILKFVYNKSPQEKDIYGYLNPLILPKTIENVLYMLDINDIINIYEFIYEINREFVFIWGENDNVVKLNDENLKIIERLKFKKLYIINGSGHCPMETETLQFIGPIIQIFYK